jgi:hypothetical protein
MFSSDKNIISGNREAKVFFLALLFLIILFGLCYRAYFKIKGQAISSLPKALVIETERRMQLLAYPEGETKAVLNILTELSNNASSGMISSYKVIKLSNNISYGRLCSIILIKGFLYKYILQSNLPEKEKDNFRDNIHRFTAGLESGNIPEKEGKKIRGKFCFIEEKPYKYQFKLKGKIKPEELQNLSSSLTALIAKYKIKPVHNPKKISEIISHAIELF